MQCVVKEKPQVQFEPVTSSAQQIGIMGGTFNPVHLAHLSMAEQVRKQLHLDEIWFIPNNTPPHKKLGEIDSTDGTKLSEKVTFGVDNNRVTLSFASDEVADIGNAIKIKGGSEVLMEALGFEKGDTAVGSADITGRTELTPKLLTGEYHPPPFLDI